MLTTRKIGICVCKQFFGDIYVVNATETDGNRKKKDT